MPQTRGDSKMDKQQGDSGNVEIVKKVSEAVITILNAKMDEMNTKLLNIERNFNDKLEKLNTLDEMCAKISDLNESFKLISSSVSSGQNKIMEISKKIERTIQHSKRNSLRFNGIEESNDVNLVEMMAHFITNNLKVSCSAHDIDCAFRIGKTNEASNKPRTILVNFVNNWKRTEAFGAKKLLKKIHPHVAIFEDLTNENYKMLLVAREKFGKDKAWSAGGKIFVLQDGKKTQFNMSQNETEHLLMR